MHRYWLKTLRLTCEMLEDRWVPADLRIVSYNITATGGNVRDGIVGVLSDASTTNDFGILDTIGVQTLGGIVRPADIILLQETDSGLNAVNTVASRLNSYYGGSVYTAGKLAGGTTGGGTQGIVYRTSTVDLLEEIVIGSTSGSGAARQPIRYKVRADGTTSDIYIYNAHLKASDTSADAQRRLVEAQLIRDNADLLPAITPILYAGDFNFYDSDASEPAYGEFRSAGNGQAVDVVSPAGNWKRESSSWVSIYTQAPTTSPGGGLVGGGLDDRFDFILMSGEWTDGSGVEYVGNTYRTFGNNGSVPLNGSINSAGNTALTSTPLSSSQQQSVLTFLTTATDHLPVVADFRVPPGTPGTFQMKTATASVNESAGIATITVERVNGSAGTASVQIMASPGTAGTQDFTPASGILTFADGQSVASFSIPILNDALDESAETILVNLSNPSGGATLGNPTGTVLSILDDDPPPSITIADASVNEGNAGTVAVTLSVSLNTPSTLPISVIYATANGTATAGSDYQSSTGPVTFIPGQTQQTITLQINGDIESEPTESFSVNLTNPVNGVITDSSAQVSILDDDTGDMRVTVGMPRVGSLNGPDLTGTALSGTMVFVPIRLRVTRTGGLNTTDLVTANIALDYDESRLEYITAARGSLLDASSSFTPPINSSGTLRLSSFDSNGTDTNLSEGLEDDLYVVHFRIRDNVNGTTTLNVLQNHISPTAPTFSTRLTALGGVIYSILPAPTNEFDSGIDRTFEVTDSVPLTINQFTVNGGDPQRSRMTQVQLTFNGTVTLTPANFTLTHTTTNTLFPGTLAVAMQSLAGQTIATLTFSGAGTEFGSLADGRYSLAVTGVAGLTGPTSFAFHRLFGDVNGDATVDGGTDFAAFAIGNLTLSNAAFDFNGDGTIDGGTDFAEFGSRFGRTV